MAETSNRHLSLRATGLGAEAATSLALVALTAGSGPEPDLVVQRLGPCRVSVVRTRRPVWALVACMCTFWMAGLGLVFLLVRRSDAGEIVVTEGALGAVVVLPPQLGPRARDAVARALQERPAPAAPVVGAPAVVVPAAPHPAPTPAAGPAALRFEAGTVAVGAGAHLVLGRDPSAGGPIPGRAVPGDASTVSKAHLLVTFDGTSMTVEDLGSTNGSTVVRSGTATDLVPGHPAAVGDGDRITLGSVACIVELPGA